MFFIHSTWSWTGTDYVLVLQSLSQLGERLGRNRSLLGRNNAVSWGLEILSVWAGINCGNFSSRRLSFGRGTAEVKDMFFSLSTNPYNETRRGGLSY